MQRQLIFCLWTMTSLLIIRPLQARDLGSLLGLGAGMNTIENTALISPARGEEGNKHTPQIFENKLRGQFVVAKKRKTLWTISPRVGYFHLSQSPVIQSPTTSITVPDELWDAEVGGAFNTELKQGRELNLSAGVGSASDAPFETSRETTLRLGAAYSKPSGSSNLWLFTLNYSNNRAFANNIPIPGVAYMINSPAHRLNLVLGFPFINVIHQSTERWMNRLTLLGPTNITAESAYSIAGPVKMYSMLEWGQSSWLRKDRPERDVRLIYDRKKWSAGLQGPLSKRVRGNFSAGYEFGRRFFESDSFFRNNEPTADLRDSWVYQLKLSCLLN
jgi:hypothetical protein